MNESLRNIWTILKRELTGYFASPVAYVFIVIFLLLNGFFTFMLGGFFELGEASLSRPFFNWHPWLYLFLVPAAGMRLWAEERRVGTLELLLTMPVTASQAIIGKFLACWAFLALALALTFPVVGSVYYLGHGGHLFLPHPRRMGTGHQPAGPLGPGGIGGTGHRVLRDAALRQLPARGDRLPRPAFLRFRDRLQPLWYQRDPPWTPRRLKSPTLPAQ